MPPMGCSCQVTFQKEHGRDTMAGPFVGNTILAQGLPLSFAKPSLDYTAASDACTQPSFRLCFAQGQPPMVVRWPSQPSPALSPFSLTGVSCNNILAHLIPSWLLLFRGLRLKRNLVQTVIHFIDYASVAVLNFIPYSTHLVTILILLIVLLKVMS